MRKIVISFLLLVITAGAFAQQMSFTALGSSLNLPSEETYNILQDSRGYIWVCTENGLCRYNGNTVKVYDKRNGLPENAVYFISEDKHGVIHLLTSQNRIMRIENDILREEPFSKKFSDYLLLAGVNLNVTYLLYIDEKGDYNLSTQSTSYKIDHITHAITNVSEEYRHRSTANYIIVYGNGENHLIKNTDLKSLYFEASDYDVQLDLVHGGQTKRIVIPFKRYQYPDWRLKLGPTLNGYTFFYLHNMLIRLDEHMNYEVYNMPGAILSLYCDKQNGIWVGMYQIGMRYYSNAADMRFFRPGLGNYSVTGIAEDREGGIWCSTLEKSVFYCSNKYVVDYSNINGLKKVCSLLKNVDDNIFMATETDNFLVMNNDRIRYIKTGFHKNVDMTDVIRYNGSWYFSSKGYLAMADDSFRMKRFVLTDKIKGNVCTFRMDTCGGRLYTISPVSVMVVQNDSLHEKAIFKNIKPRIILCYDKSTIYVGCNNGLYIYNPVNEALIKVKGISAQVTGIIKSANGKVWITTKAGLYVLKDSVLTKIRFHKNIKSDIFVDVAEDKNGTLWIALNNQLLKVRDLGDSLSAERFNLSNGLLSDNIKRVAVSNGNVFVSTTNGLCSLPVDKDFQNSCIPPVYINSVIAGGREINFKAGRLVFPYHENTLDVRFDALTYKRGQDGILLYRLSGQGDSLKVSMSNELHFENLPPDEYTLTAYAVNNDGLKSIAPAMLSFVIEKPFWQTFWFISMCVILFFTILFFSVKKVIQNIKQKEQEKTRMNKLISESQLSALQAQMNPHFIFNAINSIQNYILKKEDKEAYDYLAKFSKLIRIVLNNSRESTLPLHRELETLKLYIELEKLRFKDSFEFRLSVAEDVDEQEIYIPAMLIQPYVENAIWHGLMNLDDDRVRILKLSFSIENDLLKIVVEDNGIGRERSYAYKKESVHNPVAMKLTEQRLKMISRIRDYEGIMVTIIDVYDKEGKPAGTKVELFLPLTI